MHSAITPIRPCMSIPSTPATDTPPAFEPLIGVRELAAWLGVSDHAVKKWCSRGPESGLTPRMLRVNGQIRFRPCDVRMWLETKEVQ